MDVISIKDISISCTCSDRDIKITFTSSDINYVTDIEIIFTCVDSYHAIDVEINLPVKISSHTQRVQFHMYGYHGMDRDFTCSAATSWI